jgi:hypothetical protein
VQYSQDTTQNARALLLVAGALIGTVGMASERSWMIYIALVILAAGGVLAIMRRIKMRREER